MKRTLLHLTGAASLLLCVMPLAHAAPPAEAPILTAAVLDFQSGEERKSLGAQVSTVLTAKLSAAENLMLVERAELEKILSEAELGLSGTVSPESAVKVGHLTGAKVLITGRVFGTDEKSTTIVAKIIGTETSRVYGEMVTFPTGSSLDEPVNQLAEKIRTATKAKGDTLVAKEEESEEALIARLKRSVQGKALPTVAVEISESHMSHAVADPAAQTEMKLILQKAGFEVVDAARAERKPDVTIKGEAFSELGARRGNLVACKARVELQVIPRDAAKPAAVERQMEAAVDVSENMAGKTALQRAGARLAERVVPMLVAKP